MLFWATVPTVYIDAMHHGLLKSDYTAQCENQ